MRQSNNNSPTITDPTTIATMAPVESLDFLREGVGLEPLHGRSGGPQSPRFPTNEESGNWDNVSGIEPERLLLETSKSTKPSELMVGREAEKLLFRKKRRVK
ncbi:hypothetical protein GQ457_18G000640 [Hibiscus cannabinus]